MRNFWTLLSKDLRIELRTREALPAMTLFAITTFVIFHFSFARPVLSGPLAAGALWITLLFAALLGINRLFITEHEQGGLTALLLTPIDRSALLFAKTAALCCYLFALELVAVPIFALLLAPTLPLAAWLQLALSLSVANLGVAVIGSLLCALAVHTRARELIVPLLGLPLLVPLAIATTQITAPLLEPATATEPLAWRWLSVIALYDIVFALVTYAVFDFLLEE